MEYRPRARSNPSWRVRATPLFSRQTLRNLLLGLLVALLSVGAAYAAVGFWNVLHHAPFGSIRQYTYPYFSGIYNVNHLRERLPSVPYLYFFEILLSVAQGEDYDGIRKTLPVLVASGERDPIGGKHAVEKVAAEYRRLDLHDVTDLVFPGDRHEILNEVDGDEVRAALLGWLNAHIR